MKDQLLQFLQSPDRETYLALREAIVASKGYAAYSREIEDASKLYQEDKLEEAKDMVEKAMSNLVLSPRAHFFLGFLYTKLDDTNAARMEYQIGQICIDCILSTGDGSKDQPYLVLRTSDEYDVLEHLDKKVKQQSLTGNGEKRFDVLECEDGSEYWFDVTDALNSLTKSDD